MSSPTDLTRYLHEHIPMAAAMQLRVLVADGVQLHMAAPLAPNRNPHGTVFGGSLAALAIATGWTLLFDALAREAVDAALVVQQVDSRFLAPATGRVTAIARLPEDWLQFLQTLRTRRRARLQLAIALSCDDLPVFSATATYAARLGASTHD